jgi:hypothetical protein
MGLCKFQTANKTEMDINPLKPIKRTFKSLLSLIPAIYSKDFDDIVKHLEICSWTEWQKAPMQGELVSSNLPLNIKS